MLTAPVLARGFKHIPIVGFFAACAQNYGKKHATLERKSMKVYGVPLLVALMVVSSASFYGLAPGPNGGNCFKCGGRARQALEAR